MADITRYTQEGGSDVVLFARALHILPAAARADKLGLTLDHVVPSG